MHVTWKTHIAKCNHNVKQKHVHNTNLKQHNTENVWNPIEGNKEIPQKSNILVKQITLYVKKFFNFLAHEFA